MAEKKNVEKAAPTLIRSGLTVKLAAQLDRVHRRNR